MAEKILVVDDDVDTLRMIGILLEKQGYEILAASNGTQALAMARKEKPDLMLLDLMMPDMDGVEVTRELRADPETQNILIIMFTAKAQTDSKLEGFDAGADDYITKPAQPRELIAHVRAVLNRVQRSASAGSTRLLGARGKLVGVLAAKGGVGVTTTALNLGISLTKKFRKEVIIADFRPGQGSLGLELGFSNSQGMNHLLSRQPAEINAGNIEAELVNHFTNMRFLFSSPQPQDARYLTAVDNFIAIANYLAYLSRVTILDLGVGITPINEKILPTCDEILLVLEPVTQTIEQTRALMDYLNSVSISNDQVVLVLVNRIRAGVQLALGQVQDLMQRQVGAIFTAAPELAYQASLDNTPMLLKQPDGITAQQFHTLAELVSRRIA